MIFILSTSSCHAEWSWSCNGTVAIVWFSLVLPEQWQQSQMWLNQWKCLLHRKGTSSSFQVARRIDHHPSFGSRPYLPRWRWPTHSQTADEHHCEYTISFNFFHLNYPMPQNFSKCSPEKLTCDAHEPLVYQL